MQKPERRDRVNIKDGFTLAEIMVVVGTIGILCMIAVPAMLRARLNARMAKVQADLRILTQAIDMLQMDTGVWPGGIRPDGVGTVEMLNLASGSAGLLVNDGTFTDWRGPYVKQIPKDPWGNQYFFRPTHTVSGRTVAVVGSFGPNGTNLFDSDDICAQVEAPPP